MFQVCFHVFARMFQVCVTCFLCEFVHDETMACASNAMRVIQLRRGDRSEFISIFDTDINNDLAQNVKAKACTAFEIAVETVENVSFRQSLTVRGETMQITHMPRDIVSAYDEAKKIIWASSRE